MILKLIIWWSVEWLGHWEPLPAMVFAQIDVKWPNIVIIVTNDLGYGDLSYYGASAIKTSGMDRRTNEGVRFTQGYCTAATLTPSRYSLLTGLYLWTNKKAKILPGNAALIIGRQQIMLPKMMKKEEYVTGTVGKWYLGLGDWAVDWNETVYPGVKEVRCDYSFIQAATNDYVLYLYWKRSRVDQSDPLFCQLSEKFRWWAYQ